MGTASDDGGKSALEDRGDVGTRCLAWYFVLEMLLGWNLLVDSWDLIMFEN
jgi:hypothetical protein